MDDRDAQVGWTEAQWNRVREEVLRAWQRVRVAGSFLPVYGPLPRSTQVVPSEVLNPDGTIDDKATSVLVEIALPVRLTRQQVREEDLSSALLLFRRRATQVGQLEDWYIFNGTYPSGDQPQTTTASEKKASPAAGEEEKARRTAGGEAVAELPSGVHIPSFPFLEGLVDKDTSFLTSTPPRIASHSTQTRGLLLRDPGALGLIAGGMKVENDSSGPTRTGAESADPRSNSDVLMSTIVSAIASLEGRGYVAPYVCVFGRDPFRRAHTPVGNSIALPRDRLEPLIGRELVHASAIDFPPRPSPEHPSPPTPVEWRRRGVLLSLAGDSIDLAIAAEVTPEFRQVDVQGRYVFSVFERFALRIKDPNAIAPLTFDGPAAGGTSATVPASQDVG
jgi:uncharacterized linocin/CFP29 family protein